MPFKFTSHVKSVNSKVDAAFSRAAEIIGGMAESYAKGLCSVRTGNLRNSITHEQEDNGHTVVVGTTVKYGPYVELGHHQEVGRYVPAIGKRLVVDFVQGKPYIRPAFENHIGEFQGVLQKELSKI